jgi:hypothetical protein
LYKYGEVAEQEVHHVDVEVQVSQLVLQVAQVFVGVE